MYACTLMQASWTGPPNEPNDYRELMGACVAGDAGQPRTQTDLLRILPEGTSTSDTTCGIKALRDQQAQALPSG